MVGCWFNGVAPTATRRSALAGGLAAAGWALALPAHAQNENGPSSLAQIYGRLPAIGGVAISPDGRKLAVAANPDGASEVRIFDLDARQIVARFSAAKNQSLRGVTWADESIAIATVSTAIPASRAQRDGWEFRGGQRYLEYFRYAAIDLTTRKTALLLDKTEYSWAMTSFGALFAPIEGEPGTGRMLAPLAPGADADKGLFRVDLRSGTGRVIRRYPAGTEQILLNSRGAPIVRSETINAKKNTWRILAIDGTEERTLVSSTSEFGAPPPLLGLSGDGRLVVPRADGSSGAGELIAIDMKTGAESVFYSVDKFDVDGAAFDPLAKRVVGVSWIDDLETRQIFFDPELQAIYEKIRAALPDGFAQVVNWSRDRKRIVVLSEHAGYAGGAYFLFAPANGDLELIGRLYPDAGDRSTVQSISYPARDGVRVPAILTMPDQAAAEKPPLVVLIHGGPAARDSAHFNWWARFLADRGYVVLQPNFRGSTGYGRAWRTAGYGQWGGLMSHDVEDGVRAFIRSGRVDPGRIAFVGVSYGAYASLVAAMQSPDLVRCAVGIGGVYDLPRFVAGRLDGAERDGSSEDFWTKTLGSLSTDRAGLIARSPARNAERIKAPVLLMHGAEDSVVDASQSIAMREALVRAGATPSFTLLKGDDHWLSESATRMRMLDELDAFLARWLRN